MSTSEPLALRGRPNALSALVRGGTESLTLPVVVGDEQVFATYRPRAGGVGEMRVSLPRKTPPGKYEAVVALPDGEQRLILEVEAKPRVTFHPRNVELTGGANERVTATVTTFNEGNARIDIPQSGAAGLYDATDFECAIGRTLRDGLFGGKGLLDRVTGDLGGARILERIVEEFANDFGGTMRVNVTSGAGAIEPDAVRELALTLHLPEGLDKGSTYNGQWAFPGGALRFTIRTTGTRKEKKK